MVGYCAVGGCTNRVTVGTTIETSITLHTFPKQSAEPVRFNMWKAFVDWTRKNFVARAKSTICSHHFTIESFKNYNEVKLKKEMGMIRARYGQKQSFSRMHRFDICSMTLLVFLPGNKYLLQSFPHY